ncbi:MAG: SDR family oxidoreductase, partial [Planctomycetaceae bacterium]|nr:SDR family oxidoreductase [Planctomycetaceae bacterium]
IDLRGQTALVTGASRGIGRATAEKLASLGADVVVNFRSSADAAAEVVRAAKQHGVNALAVRADVTEKSDVEAMLEAVGERFGRLNIVVSNAAAGGFRPLTDLSPANFDGVMRSNAAPLIWLTQAARPLFAGSAESGMKKVIAVSSHGSQWAVPNYGIIGASKAALESLVRHLALELGADGISFNAVLPGIVRTEAIRTMPGAEHVLQAAGERMLVPRRYITPEDVAGVIAFLAAPCSDMIQGQTVVVDGGVCIRV